MGLKHLIRGTASILVLASLAAGGSAYAQEEEVTGVGEVIITAQKREQRLQDVPIVVTVVGEQLLKDAGVTNIKELAILTPGLTVTSTSSEASTTARIRGVGTVGDNPGLESSVGVVIDGIYRPRNGVGFGDLGKVSRIEVLKGPQGTLFGKNTSAGVINIITAEPSFNPSTEVELTMGNYSAVRGSVYATGPIISDKLAGSLYVGGAQRDGFMDVITGIGPRTKKDGNDQDFKTIRGQLAFLPNEDLSARLIVDYTQRNEDCCLATQLFVGQAPGNAALPLENTTRNRSRGLIVNDIRAGSIDTTNTPFDRVAYANRDNAQNITDGGISLEVEGGVGESMTLTSLTGIRNWRIENGQDSDFTTTDLLYRPSDGTNFSEFNQLSQELRLQGENGGLNWQVGGFFAREDLDANQILITGSDFYNYWATRVLNNFPGAVGLLPTNSMQPGSGARDTHRQKSSTWALFTNNDYAVTDKLSLTFGLRYTRDEKELISRYTTTGTTCDQAEAAYPAIVPAVTPLVTPGSPLAVNRAVALRVVTALCTNQFNNDFDELGVVKQNQNNDNVSGTVKATYKFADDVMAYVSYSRGYKAGGFNLDRTGRVISPTAAPPPEVSPNFTANPNTSFKAEEVDSYEIGAKTQFFDRTIAVNVAYFDQTFSNFQLNTFAGTAFVVETLPEVTSKGVDIDVLFRTPITGLSIQAGATFADTKISPFTAADLAVPSRFATSFFRLPGATLGFAPETSASLAMTYEHAIDNDLEIRANITGKYMSDYNTGSDLHPAKAQPGYSIFNARIGLGRQDDRWMFEVWGENIFDKEYLQVGFNGPYMVDELNDGISVYNAFLGSPATYGVTLRGKF